MMKKLSLSYMILIIVLGSITITTVLADTITIATYPYTIQDGSSNQRLVITSSGNVGIGTSNPVSLVSTVDGESVNKILRVDGTFSNAASGIEFCCRNGEVVGIYGTNGGLWVNAAGNSYGPNNNIIFATDQNNNEYSPTEKMRITAAGNVGIGTSTPSEILDLGGSSPVIRFDGTYPYAIEANTGNAIRIYDYNAGLDRFYINSAGNVGIGTSNPVSLVSTVDGESVNKILRVDGTFSNAASGIEFCCRNGEVVGIYGTNGGLWVNAAGNSYGPNNNIIFATDQNNNEYSPTEKMRITAAGNVGIGTEVPAQKLDVVGNIRLTGNIVSPNDICIGSC